LSNKKKNCEFELKKYEMNEKILNRLKLTKNITSVKKGISPLIEKAKKDRKKTNLM